jgi:hypothetical protein
MKFFIYTYPLIFFSISIVDRVTVMQFLLISSNPYPKYSGQRGFSTLPPPSVTPHSIDLPVVIGIYSIYGIEKLFSLSTSWPDTSMNNNKLGFIMNLPERRRYGMVVCEGNALVSHLLIVCRPIKLPKSGVIFCHDVKIRNITPAAAKHCGR